MATTVITQVTDDLDGSADAAPTQFGFDGKSYVIDLSRKNRAAFEKVMKPYLAAARADKMPGKKKPPTARSARATDLAAIREWAAANGLSVSPRGRVARTVVEAYDAAH